MPPSCSASAASFIIKSSRCENFAKIERPESPDTPLAGIALVLAIEQHGISFKAKPLNKSSFAKARRIALALYKSRLDPRFVYHDRRHALDVIRAARRLADLAQASPADRVLLETAAVFHDLGFISDRDDHENASADLCRRILPDCAFSSEEIECIAAMIQATRWPQNPKSSLDALLCDADLDCLGRRDFMKVSKKLREENASFGIRRSDEQWLQDEIEFLRSHRFHTLVARQLRDKGKLDNMAALLKLLNKRSR